MRQNKDRRVASPRQVTSPSLVTPLPRKMALRTQKNVPSLNGIQKDIFTCFFGVGPLNQFNRINSVPHDRSYKSIRETFAIFPDHI